MPFHLVPVVAAAEATAWTPTSPWNQDHGESWRMDQHEHDEHVEKIGEMSTKMTQNPHANYANYANWLLLDTSNHDDVGCVALGHGLRPLKLKKLVCRSLWHLEHACIASNYIEKRMKNVENVLQRLSACFSVFLKKALNLSRSNLAECFQRRVASHFATSL